jgi:hypothetical protein
VLKSALVRRVVVLHDQIIPNDPLRSTVGLANKGDPLIDMDIITQTVMGVETSVIGLGVNLNEATMATLNCIRRTHY